MNEGNGVDHPHDEELTCQCEHAAHFGPGDFPQHPVYHSYGEAQKIEDLMVVQTEYGSYRMCKACAYYHGEGVK